MKPGAVIKLVLVWFAATFGMLLGWIGLVYGLNVYAGIAITAEQVLNLMLVGFIAVIGLPVLHAATYRWFWHIRRQQAVSGWTPDYQQPAFGSEPTLPPPRVRRTPRQIATYAVLYLIGVGSLIAAYAPLGHQEALNGFLSRFSAGRASFSSLANLVVIFLPMALSFACLMPFLEADRKRLAAGQVEDAEILPLQDRQEWLGSFATAFVMAGFLSFVAGNMILSHLG